MGFVNGGVIKTLIPQLSWFLTFRIEYIAMPAATVLVVVIVGVLFPRVLHKNYLRFVLAGSAIFVLIFVLSDILFMSRMLMYFYIYLGITILLLVVQIIMKVRKISIEQFMLLASILVFVASSIFDVFHYSFPYSPLAPPFTFSGMALLIFATCQGAAVFFATLREMEAAKEAERRLSEENAAFDRLSSLKSNFLADISHEMKTPLTLMGGFADLTRWQINEGRVNDGTSENLTIIADEANRLAQLVSQLLDLSAAKESTTKGVRVLVPDIISRATALCRPMLAVNENRIEVDIEKGCPPVLANPDMILQVLFNLVSNANRHTVKGIVSITVRPVGDMVSFEVRDTGAGIPKELLSEIFERGVSGDGGTGIGLAICKEAVEAGGGTIQIESGEFGIENGEAGTIVSFTLPVYN
jgi:signal transduction histidine kinase